jgi:hypothetical protein
MSSMIEPLEGRRLLAGHGLGFADRLLDRAEAVDDPAVQATVALVRADRAAIEAAGRQLVDDSSDTRQQLGDILENGAELLAADRQAVRDSAGDAAAQAAAKAKLKADRQQLREDLAAARDALKADTAGARVALKDAITSLRDHLRQLRDDLQNASTTGGAPASPPAAGNGTPGGDGGAGGGGAGAPVSSPAPNAGRTFTFTPAQAQEAVDSLRAIADRASSIDEAAVDVLAGHLVSAAADSELTREERRQLFDDGRAVLRSLSFRDVRAIARELHQVLDTQTSNG